MPVQSSKTLGM